MTSVQRKQIEQNILEYIRDSIADGGFDQMGGLPEELEEEGMYVEEQEHGGFVVFSEEKEPLFKLQVKLIPLVAG